MDVTGLESKENKKNKETTLMALQLFSSFLIIIDVSILIIFVFQNIMIQYAKNSFFLLNVFFGKLTNISLRILT